MKLNVIVFTLMTSFASMAGTCEWSSTSRTWNSSGVIIFDLDTNGNFVGKYDLVRGFSVYGQMQIEVSNNNIVELSTSSLRDGYGFIHTAEAQNSNRIVLTSFQTNTVSCRLK